jgi:hypothetical protein
VEAVAAHPATANAMANNKIKTRAIATRPCSAFIDYICAMSLALMQH